MLTVRPRLQRRTPSYFFLPPSETHVKKVTGSCAPSQNIPHQREPTEQEGERDRGRQHSKPEERGRQGGMNNAKHKPVAHGNERYLRERERVWVTGLVSAPTAFGKVHFRWCTNPTRVGG